jgi:uncharacterized protein YprB with RNaseH-like and TPR domain
VLERTFLHCPGIGPHRERELWKRGYVDWTSFLDRHPPGGWREVIAERLTRDRAVSDLPRREAWRLVPDYLHRALYLDIETDGATGAITCIGTSDGTSVRAFVAGHDLDRFPQALEQAELLVTYNGTHFDLPILQERFPAVDFDAFLHLDLRFPLHRMGCKGGLKGAERALGIERPASIRNADGWTAVLLWRAHRQGHPRALDTLRRYCLEDAVNLKPLATMAFNHLASELPLQIDRLPDVVVPGVPYFADGDLVRRLSRPPATARTEG